MSNAKKEVQIYKFSGVGLGTAEKNWAKKRFKQYRIHYHIESLSDLQILESLVFREAIQERYKVKIGKLIKDTKNRLEIIPSHLMKSLDENLLKILILKEKLGLFDDKKTTDAYQYIQILKKKFKKWREENQGSRSLICPHCSKIILLKIKTDAWEACSHPFFKDKILANKYLWKLYKENKIIKSDIAKILNTSEDYIDWLAEKIYKSEK